MFLVVTYTHLNGIGAKMFLRQDSFTHTCTTFAHSNPPLSLISHQALRARNTHTHIYTHTHHGVSVASGAPRDGVFVRAV